MPGSTPEAAPTEEAVLAELRQILLGDEQRALRALRAELAQIRQETGDDDLLARRVRHIVEDVFSSAAGELSRRLEPELGRLLAAGVVEREADTLRSALRPLVEAAVEEEMAALAEAASERLAKVVSEKLENRVHHDPAFLVHALATSLEQVRGQPGNPALRELVTQLTPLVMAALRRWLWAPFRRWPFTRRATANDPGGADLYHKNLPAHLLYACLLDTDTGRTLADAVPEDAPEPEPAPLQERLQVIRRHVLAALVEDSACRACSIAHGDETIHVAIRDRLHVAVVLIGKAPARFRHDLERLLDKIYRRVASQWQPVDQSPETSAAVRSLLEAFIARNSARNSARGSARRGPHVPR
ncbi:MAG: hypothetical protein AB1486_17075 [Planctomycetota bacterium]